MHIFTSNRLEILAEHLSKVVRESLSDPFSPEIIVVQSSGMQRWVSMELARYNGICANCFFPFPNAFLTNIFRKAFPDLPETTGFEPSVMTFKIMRILPSCLDRPGFENLNVYLEEDVKHLKLFQLSGKIADTFDQYLVFRPEMIFAWERGEEDHWQAFLWRKLASENGKTHRAWLRKDFLEKIKNRSSEITELPERISIFGISHLPAFHMQVFAEISRLVPVNLFFMNPCREYWADIVTDREIKKISEKISTYPSAAELHLETGNRLLASMGGIGRDFFNLVSEFSCESHEQFQEPVGQDLLSWVQADILNLTDRKPAAVDAADTRLEPDGSIQIHACHSPMREIEALHDNLLAMFEEDPELLPKDILVMTPDIESYAPFIHAVFDAQTDETLKIPFTIADRSIRNESRIVEGFLSLLSLKDSRFGVAQVMTLLESPAIREKFNLAEPDLETAERWVRDTRIRWGVDAEARMKLGFPAFPENTWKAGIDRLLLGYALPGQDRRMFAGILPYDAIEGKETNILGRFLEFLDRVFSWSRSMAHSKTLAGWSMALNAVLDQFFNVRDDTEQEIRMLLRLLDDLADRETLSGFDRVIGLDVVRSHLEGCLEQENFGFGFISGGVTFCAMLPMRSIPLKVVCLVGMNSDAFPRDDRPLGFDLIAKHPKPGDRSRRNDDKYLFLEAMVSARKKLYISYVGQSVQDNTRIPPSVMVSELLDYVKEGFGLCEEDLVTRHRLQAFSPEYFKDDMGKLFSYSEENLRAGISTFEGKTPLPFISRGLPEPSGDWKALDIDRLCSFFGNPAKFFLQRRLGIFLEEETSLSNERENFNLRGLEKYGIEQDLLKQIRSGLNLKELFTVQRAKGRLPHGTVGEVFYSEFCAEADTFAGKIERYTTGKFATFEIDLQIEEFNLTGKLADIYDRTQVLIRYATRKPKDLIKTWIYHLILSTIHEEKLPANSLLICKDSAWEFGPVSAGKDILTALLRLYWKGLSEPLHFFPESSFTYAQNVWGKNAPAEVALKQAKSKWTGTDFSRGESEDPYYTLCFKETDPLDEVFQKITEDIFVPLLKHGTEIIP